MSDPTDAALDALVGEAMGALDNAMSVRNNEQYRVKLLQLCPDMIDAITAVRAERDVWKAQCEAVQREAAKCFSAQEEIDAAWDAFGTSGNRKVLSLAEQIASHQREVDDARTAYARGVHAAAAHVVAEGVRLCEGNENADTGLQFMGELADEIRALADAPPAPQCCMCGKKGLSTVEDDGGTECGLDDGRWVCSADCYDRSYPDAPPVVGVGVKNLIEALKFGASASINSLYDASGNLPEWTPDSGIGVMLAALGCHETRYGEPVRRALAIDAALLPQAGQ